MLVVRVVLAIQGLPRGCRKWVGGGGGLSGVCEAAVVPRWPPSESGSEAEPELVRELPPSQPLPSLPPSPQPLHKLAPS